jgi:hypothetical protein
MQGISVPIHERDFFLSFAAGQWFQIPLAFGYILHLSLIAFLCIPVETSGMEFINITPHTPTRQYMACLVASIVLAA